MLSADSGELAVRFEQEILYELHDSSIDHDKLVGMLHVVVQCKGRLRGCVLITRLRSEVARFQKNERWLVQVLYMMY